MSDFVPAPAPRRALGTLLVLLAAGLVGIASLALAPVENLLPEGTDVPRGLLLIQPAVLTVLFAVLGWWAAPKSGLDAPIIGGLVTGGNAGEAFRGALRPAVLVAAASAAVLVIFGWATAEYTAPIASKLPLPLATKLLYGGITEKIIARWGLLSGALALAVHAGMARDRAFWLVNIVVSLLFGAGHLGIVYAVDASPTGYILAAVLAGNIVPSLMFGWLFRIRGIECAMMAHAARTSWPRWQPWRSRPERTARSNPGGT